MQNMWNMALSGALSSILWQRGGGRERERDRKDHKIDCDDNHDDELRS